LGKQVGVVKKFGLMLGAWVVVVAFHVAFVLAQLEGASLSRSMVMP